jgi:hypothetical protein
MKTEKERGDLLGLVRAVTFTTSPFNRPGSAEYNYEIWHFKKQTFPLPPYNLIYFIKNL